MAREEADRGRLRGSVKVQIGSEIHFVRFRHSQLPYADVRTGPSIDEMATVLHFAQAALRIPRRSNFYGICVPLNIDGQISDILDRHVGSSYPDSHQTECIIRDEAYNVVASDVALCDKRDNFSKAMGRTVSFLKTVYQLPIEHQGYYLDAFANSGMKLPPREQLFLLGAGRPWSQLADRFVDFYAKTAA